MEISFEFYPPKTEQGQINLVMEAKKLMQLKPRFFSVTYGAGGSTREGTINTVLMLQQQLATPVIPHLSCIGIARHEIVETLKNYQDLGIKEIIALRGDLPSEMEYSGELNYANELVALIKEVTGDHFYIRVAAYPEIHPQAQNARDDLFNLKRKVDAGANCAITQYFFNPESYFYFIEECAKEDIMIPIIPGIMPITCFHKLARFSSICGAEIPQWIRKRLESYGDDVESIKAFGVEIVHSLCERLMRGGAPGLHFYTLNHAEPTFQLVKRLQNTIKINEELTC